MHERYKIGEAKYFLERMEESVHDREAFRYNLSAFLSAARSVLQYAGDEACKKRRSDWYVSAVTGNHVLKFFQEKRDANVHRGEPVDPARDVTIAISEGVIAFSSAAPVVVVSGDDPVATVQHKQEPSPPIKEEPQPLTPPENRSQSTVRYRFADWPGSEDLIGSSHLYIEELEKFVQRGIKEGILSE